MQLNYVKEALGAVIIMAATSAVGVSQTGRKAEKRSCQTDKREGELTAEAVTSSAPRQLAKTFQFYTVGLRQLSGRFFGRDSYGNAEILPAAHK